MFLRTAKKQQVQVQQDIVIIQLTHKRKERNTQKSEENCIRNDTKKTEALEEVQDIMQINYYGKQLKLKL